MDIYGWIFLGGLAITFLLGFLFGFGKIFKFCTSGVVGWIIGIWFCITFGGAVASIPFVNDLIVRGNAFFGGYAAILEKMNVASWIFYVALFLFILIVKKIIVLLIKRVFEPKNKKSVIGKFRSLINRGVGAVFFAAFWLVVVWALLAAVELFNDVPTVIDWVQTISTSSASKLIWGLYRYNPIDFMVLFA